MRHETPLTNVTGNVTKVVIFKSSTLMTNMIPEYKERIAIRLSIEQRQQIEKLVETGKFKHLSEVIRAALKEFLSKKGDF